MKKTINILVLIILIISFWFLLFRENSFINTYNLGNNYYKNIQDLEKSVESYENALKIKKDKKTEKNLEFVLNEIEKLKEKQEQEKSWKDEKENEKENEKKDWEKSDEEKQEDKQNSWKNDSNDSKTWDENNNLSEYSQKALQQRIKHLENEQENINKYYNNLSNDSIDPFDNFDSVFDNSLLDSWEKKDW
jgi:hypothetical protein